MSTRILKKKQNPSTKVNRTQKKQKPTANIGKGRRELVERIWHLCYLFFSNKPSRMENDWIWRWVYVYALWNEKKSPYPPPLRRRRFKFSNYTEDNITGDESVVAGVFILYKKYQ